MEKLQKFNFFNQYQIVIFDLDNTLYVESEYLFAVYDDIGKFVEKYIGGNSEIYSTFLKDTFRIQGRQKIFDLFLSYFNLNDKIKIDDLLLILRHKKILLKVYEEVKEILQYLLASKHMIYILTNGNIEQQKNKINNLDIQDMLANIEIIFADKYISKPSPYCINRILLDKCIDKKKVLMIGDSVVDYLAAQSAGIDFININYILNNGFAKN